MRRSLPVRRCRRSRCPPTSARSVRIWRLASSMTGPPRCPSSICETRCWSLTSAARPSGCLPTRKAPPGGRCSTTRTAATSVRIRCLAATSAKASLQLGQPPVVYKDAETHTVGIGSLAKSSSRCSTTEIARRLPPLGNHQDVLARRDSTYKGRSQRSATVRVDIVTTGGRRLSAIPAESAGVEGIGVTGL